MLPPTNTKRKIIFITPNLNCGGAPKVLSLICQNLNNEKYEVVLVCINLKNRFYAISNPAVRVIDLGKKHIKSSAAALFFLFKKEKPNFVFSNGQDLNILMALFKRVFRDKIHFICRETSVLSVNNSTIRYRNTYNFSIRKLYNALDKIICQSQDMYDDLAEKYHVKKSRLQIISNPVVVPGDLSHQPRFNNTGEMKLLAIGRLVPEKGTMRLLQAVALLKTPFRLIVLGDGPEKEELVKEVLRSGISDYVTFKGNVKDTNDYIADCDYVLFGSYHEGFPNIVLEAGILGKPVIAFKAPGVNSEVIKNTVTGLLVQGGSITDFCDAIQKARTIQFDKNNIARFVLEKYGIDKIMREYEKLFEQIIPS